MEMKETKKCTAEDIHHLSSDEISRLLLERGWEETDDGIFTKRWDSKTYLNPELKMYVEWEPGEIFEYEIDTGNETAVWRNGNDEQELLDQPDTEDDFIGVLFAEINNEFFEYVGPMKYQDIVRVSYEHSPVNYVGPMESTYALVQVSEDHEDMMRAVEKGDYLIVSDDGEISSPLEEGVRKEILEMSSDDNISERDLAVHMRRILGHSG